MGAWGSHVSTASWFDGRAFHALLTMRPILLPVV